MQVKVRTTQNVFIHYPVASLGDRIVAHLIDWVALIGFVILMVALYVNIKMEIIWVWIVTVGVPFLFYHMLFEIFMNGQTPGKRAVRIKVIRLDGTPASVGDYILRWIFGFVDLRLMSGLIAVITIAVSEKGQRLGDMVAGTTVIKIQDEASTSSSDIFIPKTETDYVPSFPQVIQLTERDIELIQRALEVNRTTANLEPVLAVSAKVRSLLGIETEMAPLNFLYTIIKDFQHLTSK